MLLRSVIAYLSLPSIMSLERNPPLACELELCQAAQGGSTGVISPPGFRALPLSPFLHPASSASLARRCLMAVRE